MADTVRRQKTKGIMRRWIRNNMLIIIILITVGVTAYSLTMRNSMYDALRTSLTNRATTGSVLFSGTAAATYAEHYDHAYEYVASFADAGVLELQFVDVQGRVEISSYGITAGSVPGTEDITQALETGEIRSWQGVNPQTGERIMAVSAPVIYSSGEVVGVLRYVTGLSLVQRQAAMNTAAAVLVGAAMLLIILITNMFFIRSVVTPVREVTRMVGRIAEGSYGTRISRRYRDEVGEMVDSINEMSMRISAAERMQTEFISSISHELRTPLTAITGWSETLLYDDNITPDQQKGVNVILREARRLTKMVEQLMEFTRMQDGRFTLNVQKTLVLAELEDTVMSYGELLRQDGIEIHYDPWDGDEPEIDADPERLRQVFLNLLDNAAKYGRSGGRIDVSSVVGQNWVLIRIRDYGPGIPSEELDNVRKKFYKINQKSRGSGIGLAVCDDIIRYHNGQLVLNNAVDGGLEVTIMLPISDEIF